MSGVTRTARGVALVVVLLGLSGAYWLHVESGLEWTPETLETLLADLGPLAPLLFVGISEQAENPNRQRRLVSKGKLAWQQACLPGTGSSMSQCSVATLVAESPDDLCRVQ